MKIIVFLMIQAVMILKSCSAEAIIPEQEELLNLENCPVQVQQAINLTKSIPAKSNQLNKDVF